MKKLLLTCLILLTVKSYAVTPEVPEIYEVYDLKSNQTLLAKSENELHSIASLSKLMTAHVFLKNYPQDIAQCITHISDDDRDDIKHTHTRIYKNQPISCENLIQLMLLVSDNYAASALAGSLPNVSKEDFYELMNKEAQSIGMKQTYYKDSSGLSFENKSTATDLLKLVKVLMKSEKMKELASIYAVNLKSGDNVIEFKNSNQLIRDNLYTADLSKTGYISESGYNLIFVPKQECDNKKLVIIIMGAKSTSNRLRFVESLLKKYKCIPN